MDFLRALSLDVVAGAACGGLLAEQVARAHMSGAWWIALLAAVWSIYTGDHLLDALRAPGPLLTYRHRLHRRHARGFTAALLVAVVVGFAAALSLRAPLRIFGVGLSLAVVLYLASAQRLILPSLPKEPVAGILYAAGIWGGPLLVGASSGPWPLVGASLQALAAGLNLTALGFFEAEVDRGHGARSLALRVGLPEARRWVIGISAAGSVATIGLLVFANPSERLCFAVLGIQIAMQGALMLAVTWFARARRYRAWGDSVFLLGALPRLVR